MVIVMTPEATAEDVARVVEKVESVGGEAFVSKGVVRTIIGLVGDIDSFHGLNLRSMPGVGDVHRISDPYKLVSRQHHPDRSTVWVRGVPIGPDTFTFIAGPCAVESPAQTLEAAEMAKAAGATLMRGGAYKPRTSPYAFQGLGVERPGDPRPPSARRPACRSSPRSSTPATCAVVAEHADMLQVGTRNMANFGLLQAVGESGKPVLLKRGMTATIEEWLMAAEYIAQRGNLDVVLCERGIRTFEPATRNTLDISAVPVVQATSHLPIIVDPSHAAGRKDLVVPLSRAAIAVGADGVIVDVHPDPESALCDGPQALLGADLRALAQAVRQLPPVVGRVDASTLARTPVVPALSRVRPRRGAVPSMAWQVAEPVLLRGLLAVDLALRDVGQEDLDGHALAVLEGDRDGVPVGRRRRWSRPRRRAGRPASAASACQHSSWTSATSATPLRSGSSGWTTAGLARRRSSAHRERVELARRRRAAPRPVRSARSSRSSRSSWVSSLVSSRQVIIASTLPQHGRGRARSARGVTSRCVTIRSARGPDRGHQHAVLARPPPPPPGASGTSTTTMFECTRGGLDAARLGEEPRVLVVVGQPLDVVVEGVQPRRGQHADLAHAAAEPLAPHPGLVRSRPRSPTTREPTGAPRPLLRQTARTSAHRAVLRRAGCRSRRARSRSGRRRRARRSRGRRRTRAPRACRRCGVTAPPPKLWVFSTEIARVATKNGPMSGANIVSIVARSTGRPTQVRMVRPVNAPCAPSSARAMCADASQSTSSPDPDQRADRQHVGHRPGGGEQRRLLAEQAGDPLLERADGRVLAVHVVADLGATPSRPASPRWAG